MLDLPITVQQHVIKIYSKLCCGKQVFVASESDWLHCQAQNGGNCCHLMFDMHMQGYVPPDKDPWRFW